MTSTGSTPTSPQQDNPYADPDLLASFRSSLRGRVIGPEDAAYDASRAVWNGMIDRRPAAIAECLGVSDVLACLESARENDVSVSIRGGGHHIAGLAVADDTLLIDCSQMRGVHVYPEERRAVAQAGCILSDVDRETQVHGLAAVLGFVSTTGIAGLTLGGGFGYLTRRFGWTCDNVISMQVVTADGRIVRAAEDENPDLFWGLRGGGGNFGIVTEFEYRLHEVGPEILGGGIAWRAEQAPAVLETYRKIQAEAPAEFTCVLGLRVAPPAPWIDPSVHGKNIIVLFVCHTGSIDAGSQLVDRLRSVGSPVGDVIQPRSYLSQQTILDATQPKGRRYYWKSEYLPGLSPEMDDALIEHAARAASPNSAVLIFPLGEAISDLPEDHCAAGNRDARYVLNVAAGWDDPAGDEANMRWARNAADALRPWATGGTYINFQAEDEGEDRLHTAYRDNYDRLVEIKSRWDPGNVFRHNRNIPPAADS